MTDMALLEHTVRDEFNRTATRRLVVLRPIKVVLTNYPEGKTEELDAINNPEDPNAGTRKIPFGRELYIERDDFMETPPPKYFRLRPGGEVRLKYAYIIKCEEVVKDDAGNVTELRCSVDLDSKSGGPTAGRKVKGTIHWVSAAHAIDAEVRLYDRLFTVPEPDSASAEGSGETGPPRDFKSFINSNSLEVANAKCEPALANARPEERYQFERLGYFTLDPDSTVGKASVEPHGHVERYLGEGSEEVGERTRLACCFRRPRRKCRTRPSRDAKPFDEPSNSARQQRALPIRTSPALGRCAPALFLSRALRANDKDSVPQCCQSPRAVSGERLRRVLRRALPR